MYQPSSLGIEASGVGVFLASIVIDYYDGQYMWVEIPKHGESFKILIAKTMARLSSTVSKGLYNLSCKLVSVQLSSCPGLQTSLQSEFFPPHQPLFRQHCEKKPFLTILFLRMF